MGRASCYTIKRKANQGSGEKKPSSLLQGACWGVKTASRGVGPSVPSCAVGFEAGVPLSHYPSGP